MPSSRRSSSYLHGFCAMIPHRGTLFLVKRRSLARRLSAPRPLFVAPTGLWQLPRLRPNPRLDLSSASGSLRLPFTPFGLAHYYPRLVRSSTSQRSSAFRHRVSHTHLRNPSCPCLLPHLDLRSRCPRPTPVSTLPPSSPSTMPSASYRSSSATSTPAPLLRRVPPTPVENMGVA